MNNVIPIREGIDIGASTIPHFKMAYKGLPDDKKRLYAAAMAERINLGLITDQLTTNDVLEVLDTLFN